MQKNTEKPTWWVSKRIKPVVRFSQFPQPGRETLCLTSRLMHARGESSSEQTQRFVSEISKEMLLRYTREWCKAWSFRDQHCGPTLSRDFEEWWRMEHSCQLWHWHALTLYHTMCAMCMRSRDVTCRCVIHLILVCMGSACCFLVQSQSSSEL